MPQLQRQGLGHCAPTATQYVVGHRGLVPESRVHLSLPPIGSTVQSGATEGEGRRKGERGKEGESERNARGYLPTMARLILLPELRGFCSRTYTTEALALRKKRKTARGRCCKTPYAQKMDAVCRTLVTTTAKRAGLSLKRKQGGRGLRKS